MPVLRLRPDCAHGIDVGCWLLVGMGAVLPFAILTLSQSRQASAFSSLRRSWDFLRAIANEAAAISSTMVAQLFVHAGRAFPACRAAAPVKFYPAGVLLQRSQTPVCLLGFRQIVRRTLLADRVLFY